MANEPTMLRHFVSSFVIFIMLSGLFAGIYTNITDYYDIDESYYGENVTNERNIVESFQNLTINKAINDIAVSMNNIQDPTAGGADIVGELLSSALGVINFVLGFVVLPFQIFAVINQYYSIPGYFTAGMVLLLIIYVGFIWRSAQMRGDV